MGRSALGMNAQYFSRYRVLASDAECCSGGIETLQGSQFVQAQTYLDLAAQHSSAWTQEMDLRPFAETF